MPEINSQEYWDSRFEYDWETRRGPEQSQYFIKLIIDNLPVDICSEIEENCYSILDWGCALGQGVEALLKRFGSSQVTGLDFSVTAISKCRLMYQRGVFRSEPLVPGKDMYDVIVTSNCLEHFYDPFNVMKQHLQCTGKYYIILVPFKEPPYFYTQEHKFVFNESSFPERMDGFERVVLHPMDTHGSFWWEGYQVLVVYKKVI